MMIGKITKAQRREERKTLGTLEELLVKKKTLDKYHSHFNRFCEWAEFNVISLRTAYDFDSAASLYVEGLWADGFGRAEGSYLLAALQHMLPMLKHQLNLAWRLMKTWSKNELPTRAVPLDASTVLGFAGLFWVWKEPQLAAGIVVAFDFFLRTGELFTLRRQHVEFFASQASLQLTHTKSTTYQIHSERLLAWDALAIGALRFLAFNKEPPDFLVPRSAASFRTLWHKAVKFFLLQDFFIQPYSLRRGGATSAFRSGVSFDSLLVRGRWANQRTARIYLDEALQQSSLLSFSTSSQARLSWAKAQFPIDRFARLGRMDGGWDQALGWSLGKAFNGLRWLVLPPKWWNTLSFRYFCWKQLKRSVRAAVLSVCFVARRKHTRARFPAKRSLGSPSHLPLEIRPWAGRLERPLMAWGGWCYHQNGGTLCLSDTSAGSS